MKLGTIFIIFIIVLYVYIYTRPRQLFELLQVSVDKFTPDMLVEKQPIILFSKLVKINQFIDVCLKYHFCFRRDHTLLPETTIRNHSKFALIHNNSGDDIKISLQKKFVKGSFKQYFSEIDNEHDINLDEVTVLLKPFNVIVLPYLFEFQSSHEVDVTFLNDIFHSLCF